jgi:hypothetical protein
MNACTLVWTKAGERNTALLSLVESQPLVHLVRIDPPFQVKAGCIYTNERQYRYHHSLFVVHVNGLFGCCSNLPVLASSVDCVNAGGLQIGEPS